MALRQAGYPSVNCPHTAAITRHDRCRSVRIISALSARMPPDVRALPEVEEMAGYGCLTQVHVVRLLAPGLAGETHLKDIDFSPAGIAERWKAG